MGCGRMVDYRSGDPAVHQLHTDRLAGGLRARTAPVRPRVPYRRSQSVPRAGPGEDTRGRAVRDNRWRPGILAAVAGTTAAARDQRRIARGVPRPRRLLGHAGGISAWRSTVHGRRRGAGRGRHPPHRRRPAPMHAPRRGHRATGRAAASGRARCSARRRGGPDRRDHRAGAAVAVPHRRSGYGPERGALGRGGSTSGSGG